MTSREKDGCIGHKIQGDVRNFHWFGQLLLQLTSYLSQFVLVASRCGKGPLFDSYLTAIWRCDVKLESTLIKMVQSNEGLNGMMPSVEKFSIFRFVEIFAS